MIRIGSPQWMYMMETEGLLDTREGRINAVIRDLRQYYKQGYDVNDPALQEKVLSKYDLNHQLTDRESDRIAKAVLK